MCLKLGQPDHFFARTVSKPPRERVTAGVKILEDIGAIQRVQLGGTAKDIGAI